MLLYKKSTDAADSLIVSNEANMKKMGHWFPFLHATMNPPPKIVIATGQGKLTFRTWHCKGIKHLGCNKKILTHTKIL